MVLRSFKVPKHGGPDGQGLPKAVFEELLILFRDSTVSDKEAQAAMLLSFDASTAEEWNNSYRPELIVNCVDTDKK
jgi:hypothetical protein